MEKIYGYKEKDVIQLAKFISERKDKTLTKTFKEFAVEHGKSKGTVRNLYYALAKLSNKDQEFCDRYLNGQPIFVSEVENFSKEQEKELVKKVLLLKHQGKSVRNAINILANGEAKLALRYQNKYRNFIKTKREEWNLLIEEIKKENGVTIELETIKTQEYFNEFQLKRLKAEINGLVSRISQDLQKENQMLKERINFLQSENLKLNRLLYGTNTPIEYFSKHNLI